MGLFAASLDYARVKPQIGYPGADQNLANIHNLPSRDQAPSFDLVNR
jgi:hypothetical protein